MSEILLASKSPRRLELLQMLGFQVTTIVPDVDEGAVDAESPAQLAQKLSRLKAEAASLLVAPTDLPIIAADTLVEVDKKVLGKPHSPANAKEMLLLLSGKRHYVHTGITVIYNGSMISAVESAAVDFRKLSGEEIDTYVRSGAPMDKAGSYGIQGPAGAFVERIEGDYFAIVGLPLCRLTTILHEIKG